MKRILFIIDSLEIGGVENVLISLLNNIDHTRFSIDLLIVYGQYDRENLIDSAVKIRHLHKRNHLYAASTICRYIYGIIREILPKWIIRKSLSLDQYDVVIDYKGLNCNILRAASGRKIVWSHGDRSLKTNSVEAEYVRRHGSKISERIKMYFYKKTLRVCDGIVCISQTMKSHFEDRFGYADKTVALYNPIDIERVKKLGQVQLPQEIVNPDSFVFCCVSRITSGKGVERLIEASERLQGEGYEFQLLIVGGGDKFEEIKCNMTAERPWVKMIGPKDNPFQYLSNCDAFVCPSETEAGPLVVIEALALGVPVISTDVGSVREMLGDSEFGMVVENSGDGIYKGMLEFLVSPEALQRYRTASVKRGGDFELSKVVCNIETYLEGKE